MKIAFDSNAFTMQRFGGVSRYLVRLAEEFTDAGHDVKVHGFFHINQYLAETTRPVTRMRRIARFPKLTRRATHFLNDMRTEIDFLRESPDLIHESYCHSRRVGSQNLPRVCTVHDMIHDLFPQYWGKMDRTPEYRRATIARADAVLCVSESTRQDLIRITGIAPDKTHVVHHGFEIEGDPADLKGQEQNQLDQLLNRPYLLYVGGRENYKNFQNMLRGFARTSALRDVSIVAFGGGPLRQDELARAESLGIPAENLLQYGGSDALLRALYRNALAFIYPSLYEGFGFPPLEAMSEDCPVISSNASCMPEVIGDAAHFFDPQDEESIAAAIEQVLQSTELQADLVAKGRNRLRSFSWEKCARETMAVYQSVL